MSFRVAACAAEKLPPPVPSQMAMVQQKGNTAKMTAIPTPVQRAAASVAAASVAQSKARLQELARHEQRAIQVARHPMVPGPPCHQVAIAPAAKVIQRCAPEGRDTFLHDKWQASTQRRHFTAKDSFVLDHVEGRPDIVERYKFERQWAGGLGVSTKKSLPQQESPGVTSYFGNEMLTLETGVKRFEVQKNMQTDESFLADASGEVVEDRLCRSRRTMEARAADIHAPVPWAAEADGQPSADRPGEPRPAETPRAATVSQPALCVASPDRAPHGLILTPRMASAQTSRKNECSRALHSSTQSEDPAAMKQDVFEALGQPQSRGRSNIQAQVALQRSPHWAATGGGSPRQDLDIPQGYAGVHSLTKAAREGVLPIREFSTETKWPAVVFMPRKSRLNTPAQRQDTPWASGDSEVAKCVDNVADAAGNPLTWRRARSADAPRSSLCLAFWEAENLPPAEQRTTPRRREAVVRMSSCEAVETRSFRQRASSASRRLDPAERLDGPRRSETPRKLRPRQILRDDVPFEETMSRLQAKNLERIKAIRQALDKRREDNRSVVSSIDFSDSEECDTPRSMKAHVSITPDSDRTPSKACSSASTSASIAAFGQGVCSSLYERQET